MALEFLIKVWMNTKLSKYKGLTEDLAYYNLRLWSLLMFRLSAAGFSLELAFKIARAINGIWYQPLPANCHSV